MSVYNRVYCQRGSSSHKIEFLNVPARYLTHSELITVKSITSKIANQQFNRKSFGRKPIMPSKKKKKVYLLSCASKTSIPLCNGIDIHRKGNTGCEHVMSHFFVFVVVQHSL